VEANCGEANGSFTIEAQGGNGGYKYAIGTGSPQSSGDFAGLPAGKYDINVTDASGCGASLSVTINDNGNVTIEGVTSENADCGASNGSISISATGTGSLTYSIDGVNFTPNSTIANVSAGMYTVTVKDAKSCVSTSSIEVLESGGITIDNVNTTNAGCKTSDGSVTVSASGGSGNYTYSLNGGAFQSSNTFSKLGAGTHTVTTKDTGGCQKSAEATISSGVSYKLTVGTIISSKCAISGCHIGGPRVDFTKFSNVQANADEIKSRTQSGNMPQKGSLSQSEKDQIACWVDDGALNN